MTQAPIKGKPAILFIHNKYLQSGGEDSVVQNEILALRQNGYPVFYQEFNNTYFLKKGFGKLLIPFSIFFNVTSFLRIYFFLKKRKIELVHVHNFFYHASPSVFWAAKAAGARTFFTMHNYRLFCLNGIFFRSGKVCFSCHTNGNFKMGIQEKCFKSSRIFSRAFAWSIWFHRKSGTWAQKVDKFIVINQFMKELLISQGIGLERIVVKQNVLSEYDHKGLANYHERKDFYLYVGRLSNEKGIHHLLNAFTVNGKKLLIAGDGELSGYVMDNAGNNIEYLGPLSKKEIFKLYETCKALIFPSLWIEGMPMTIIEAQSSGTICIAAESINTKEMIRNEINGLLFEAGNSNDLIRVIKLFEDKSPEEINLLSENTFNHFMENYSETQHIKAVEELYHF